MDNRDEILAEAVTKAWPSLEVVEQALYPCPWAHHLFYLSPAALVELNIACHVSHECTPGVVTFLRKHELIAKQKEVADTLNTLSSHVNTLTM